MSYELIFFCLLDQLSILQGYDSSHYNLPADHMPYYFRSFTDEMEKCLSDDDCPHKDLPEILPCWGYESDCLESNSFSRPECPYHHKGWVKTKKEQIDTFYNQGDFGYVKHHRNNIMVMCEPTFKEDSALECSDHLHFCRGRNIFMNFTSLVNRPEPFRYKMDVFNDGDIGGYCHFHRTRLLNEADRLSPLQSWGPELKFFTQLQKRPIKDSLCDVVMEKPVFIMKIDATVNMYHHMCDFLNLYASLHINTSHPSTFSTDVHIVIWETYPYYSAFADMWKAFTSKPLLTLRNFSGKRVCFKNVILPLLPRMIFGLFYNTPLVYGCEKSGLFKAFSEFVLHRLNIPLHTRNSSQIRVTLLSRETSYRNILNEKELLLALSKNELYEVRRAVFNRQISFKDQLEIIRNTDIFVGMHGAGLTHLLFLPDWAGVFELYNCEDENCYADLARLRGVKYVTWENSDKLTQEDEGHHPDGGAHAKFTNYAFDVEEFVRLINKLGEHVEKHAQFQAFVANGKTKEDRSEERIDEHEHDEL